MVPRIGHSARSPVCGGMLLSRCSRIRAILSISALLIMCLPLVSCTLIEGWISGMSNNSPHAFIAANPSSGNAPLVVQFNAFESSDPDGDALRYYWDFGDGASGSGVTILHTYSEAQAGRTINVVLTVTDEHDATDTATASISIAAKSHRPPPPPF